MELHQAKDLIVADKIRIKVKIDEASRVWLYQCQQSRASKRYKNLFPLAMKNVEFILMKLGKNIDINKDVLKEIRNRDTIMVQRFLSVLESKNLIFV